MSPAAEGWRCCYRLEFKIDDIYRAVRLGMHWKNCPGNAFMSTNWMEQNKAIFSAHCGGAPRHFITIGLIVFFVLL